MPDPKQNKNQNEQAPQENNEAQDREERNQNGPLPFHDLAEQNIENPNQYAENLHNEIDDMEVEEQPAQPEAPMVVGRDISKAEYKQRLASLKNSNKILNLTGSKEVLVREGLYEGFSYKGFSDKEIQKLALDPKLKRIQDKAKKVLERYRKMQQEAASGEYALPKGAGAMSRMHTAEFDLSYLDMDEKKDAAKIREIKEKNRDIIAKYADINERKACYRRVMDRLNGLDLSKAYSDDPEETLDFIDKNLQTIVAAMGIRSDIYLAVETDQVHDEQIDTIYNEKGVVIEDIGGYLIGLTAVMSANAYPLMAKQIDATFDLQLGLVRDDYTDDEDYDDLDNHLEKLGASALKGKLADEEYGPQLKAVAEAGAISYVPYNSRGEKISVLQAYKNMRLDEFVLFRERNPEEGQEPKEVLFKGNSPAPDRERDYFNMDPARKTEIIDKWFESFKAEIDKLNEGADPSQHFDLNDAFDPYRLHSVEVGSRDGVQMIAHDRDLNGTEYGTLRNTEFTDNARSLNDLTPEQKEKLYKRAAEGSLMLHSKTGKPDHERAIYVKEDGSCGITMLNQMYMSDAQVQDALAKYAKEKNDPTQFYRDIFPDAQEPELLTSKYRSIYKAVRNHMQAAADHPKNYTYAERSAYQLYAIKDLQQNPEFYQNKVMVQNRLDIISVSLKDQISKQKHIEYLDLHKKFAFLNPGEAGPGALKAKDYDYGNHPIAESLNIQALLRRNMAELKAAGQEVTLDQMIKGYVRNDKNTTYQPENNDFGREQTYEKNIPWRASEQIAKDMMAGRTVYLDGIDPETHAQKTYRFSRTAHGCELKETSFVLEEERNKFVEMVRSCKNILDKGGTTKRDSAEFTAMKKQIDKTVAFFSDPERLITDRLTIEEKMQDLYHAADKYFMAKLNEPKNSRRLERFVVAETLRLNTSGDINIHSDKQYVKDNILASRALKLKLEKQAARDQKIMSSRIEEYNEALSRGEEAKLESLYSREKGNAQDDPQVILNNPDKFLEKAAEYMESEEFGNLKNIAGIQDATADLEKKLERAAAIVPPVKDIPEPHINADPQPHHKALK